MKVIFAIAISILLVACESSPFTGYIVAKEYIEGHMCHDENYEHFEEAIVVVPPHVNSHHHEWQESEFIIHVANKNEVRHIHVDSLDFLNYKLLDKVTFE
jgi:hypothetical protein